MAVWNLSRDCAAQAAAAFCLILDSCSDPLVSAGPPVVPGDCWLALGRADVRARMRRRPAGGARMGLSPVGSPPSCWPAAAFAAASRASRAARRLALWRRLILINRWGLPAQRDAPAVIVVGECLLADACGRSAEQERTPPKQIVAESRLLGVALGKAVPCWRQRAQVRRLAGVKRRVGGVVDNVSFSWRTKEQKDVDLDRRGSSSVVKSSKRSTTNPFSSGPSASGTPSSSSAPLLDAARVASFLYQRMMPSVAGSLTISSA